jgi:flagellin
MGLRINTNATALNAHKNLSISDSKLTKSIGKLSSGLRINQAKDDVAGLQIANKFRSEVRSLRVAQQNAAQATAMLQVAEGAANQVEGILERMKELAMTSASENTTDDGRSALQAELEELIGEIDRIASDTEYNGLSLIDGTTTGLDFQVGSADTANDRIAVDLSNADYQSATLGVDTASIDISTSSNAQSALDTIDGAISTAGVGLGDIGAAQSRLEFASANLATSIENLAASESTIRDLDMALEMTNFTKTQIMLQAGTAMLAQANMAPQQVLSLFG